MFNILEQPNTRDGVSHVSEILTIVDRYWMNGREFYFELEYFFEPSFWLIPAVVYNGNKIGTGNFLRPDLDEGWFFREDRCAIPSGAIVEDDKNVVGVFAEPAKNVREISSVSIQRNRIIIRIPWAEKPARYVKKGKISNAKATNYDSSKGYRRRFYVIHARYRDKGYKRGYYLVLREAWKILGKRETISHRKIQRFINLKASFARNVHYFSLGKIAGFLLFVLPNTPFCCSSMSASFLGKSVEAALSFYRLYMINGDTELKEIAFKVADFFCSGFRRGLLYTDYIVSNRRWYGYFMQRIKMFNTRQIGEALYFLLRLYTYAAKKGEAKKNWLRVAKHVGGFFVDNQLENGSFGTWISPDTKKIVDTGTNGAYIIWFLLKLYELTGAPEYLTACKKAASYYIQMFVERDIYWGDTLDSHCIDKEGAHAILRSMLMLYSHTMNQEYLEAAIRAAYYLATWMFMWNIPFEAETILGKMNFKTFGWTAVSVENQHLDPYGLVLASDFVRLYRYTKDEFWLQLGVVMASSVLNFISLREGHLGVSKFFVGYQPEQILHTEWLYSSALQLLMGIFLYGTRNIIGLMKGKGYFANNVFWVVSATLGGALDLAEELSI
ncbi:MAG: hypothetical protein Q6363_002085, partial [Candidatus Njordarchaeota archaeon]